jgi:ubiquinone/menaquinone biosynthesis C-methylase UbiE
MSVASHLGIALDEYDARIRTFIPDYEEMLAAGGACVPSQARTIVDLGIGTGALAARTLESARRATIVGIDTDAEILDAARRRLGRRARFLTGSFLRVPLPRCDAIVGSLALHHVRTRPAKAGLYRRIARALRRRGVFVTVDCHPAADAALADMQRAAWTAHLSRSYGRRGARGFLAAWAREDVYVPLEAELRLIARAGLRPEVVWRKGPFAVIRALR